MAWFARRHGDGSSRRRLGAPLALVLAAVAPAALVAPRPAAAAPADPSPAVEAGRSMAGPGRAGITPLQRAGTADLTTRAPTAEPHLSYYGGPVISNVDVVQVLFGDQGTWSFPAETTRTAAQKPSVAHFLSEVVTSGHLTEMSEYDTTATDVEGNPGTGQHIGVGTFQGPVTIDPPPGIVSAPSIDDADVQAVLDDNINSGALPAPQVDADGHADTLYMVMLRRNQEVCLSPGACSLVRPGGFCGYHSSFRLTGTGETVVYSVHPDLTTEPRLCSDGFDAFKATTAVLSHELIEAVTDPEIAFATTAAPPLAWYDLRPGYAEVTDICEDAYADLTLDGHAYRVQQQWSNGRRACITPGTPLPSGAFVTQPSSLTVVAGRSVQVPVRQVVPAAATYSVSGVPIGMTATFSNATVAAGAPTDLTLAVDTSAVSSSVVLTVASSTGVNRSLHVRVLGFGDPDAGAALDVTQPLVRLADTRTAGTPVGPGESIRVATTAAGASAVVLNVTATEATAAAFVTVWPCDQGLPLASNLNVQPRQTVANLVTVALATDASVCVYNSTGRTHVVVDQLSAYRPSGGPTGSGRFVPMVPARVLDTRDTTRFAAGEARVVDLTGAGVPSDALAAVLTVTGVDAVDAGFWSVWPAGPWPGTSNLNLAAAGQTRANQVIVPVADGTVSVLGQVGGDLVIDVAGYFTGASAAPSQAGLFHAVSPVRVADTRDDATGRLTEGRLNLTGVTPSSTTAVAMNVTVTEPVAAGFVTAYPAGNNVPLASNVNFADAATVPNHVVVGTVGNRVDFYANVPVHLVIDVNGWYS